MILLYMAVWAVIILIITFAEVDPIVFAVIGPAIFILYFPWFFWTTSLVWLFKTEVTPPVSLETLREEILAINTFKSPVVVNEKNGKLIVTWNYLDAKWWEVFAKVGLKQTYELVLKFNDEKKEVKMIDISRTVSWRTGITDLRLHASYFRGIMMEYSIGKQWGIKENFSLGKIYDYKFTPSEIKTPVMNTILKSGWNVRFALV